jgi:hypothetical protein
MTGYIAREGPSLGVRDELWCRAVVLDDGAARLALVSLDLLGLDFELEASLRQKVMGAADLPADHLLLNCSHTHAGPAVTERPVLGIPDEAYGAALPARVAETAAEAAARLSPARLRYGVAPARIGVNRRRRDAEGRITFGADAGGAADRLVRVVAIDGEEGGPRAVIFNHACHGTTLDASNRLISSEWMGAACAEVRKRVGGEVVPMFLQGCCGQINPRGRWSGESIAELGSEMAECISRALEVARPLTETRLAAALERIELPVRRDREFAEGMLALASGSLKEAKDRGLPPIRMRVFERLVEAARGIRDAPEAGLPFAVQGLGIGELGIAALSGEIFFELGEEIEAGSPFEYTMALGNSNGCTGYVPTAEAFEEGGYEPNDSCLYYGRPPLSPEAGGEMVAAALRLLARIREG